jgi:hypothetical protein
MEGTRGSRFEGRLESFKSHEYDFNFNFKSYLEEKIADTKCGIITVDCCIHRPLMITSLHQSAGPLMASISPLALTEWSNFVIKLGKLKILNFSWSYSFHKTNVGSTMKLNWSSDSTMVAGAGGNGQVIFGQVVDR